MFPEIQKGPSVTLGRFRVKSVPSVNPAQFPDEEFDLFSVPNFPLGVPERVKGSDIGSSKKVVGPNTVLFCKINPRINRVWTVPEREARRQIASTEWIQYSTEEHLEADYLRYFLSQNCIRDFAAANVSGVGGSLTRSQPNVLDGIKVPVPSLDEQRRIVEAIQTHFSRLDDAVAALQRVRTRLKRYRASVLKAACEGRLVPTEAELARQEGRSYEPASVLLERIRAERAATPGQRRGKENTAVPLETSALPNLPEGWAWTRLPELGELGRGKSKHRPRNDERLMGGPYPFIQTSEVRLSDGRINSYQQTYSEFGLSQSRLWPAGTVCITIAANIAATGILSFDACFPDSVVGFIIHTTAGDARFVEAFIRTQKDDLEQLAPATAQKNINLNTLDQIVVPLPPKFEQDRIVAEVERRMSIIEQMDATVERNLKRTEALRQSILRKAFRVRFPMNAGHVDEGEDNISGTNTESLSLGKVGKLARFVPIKVTSKQTGTLLETLLEMPSGSSPEGLFEAARFGEESIEKYYEELRTMVHEGKVTEQKSDGLSILRPAVHDEA